MAPVMWLNRSHRLTTRYRCLKITSLQVALNISSAPEAELKSDIQVSSPLLKNVRDVPFLYLPHSVKKAYVVHETNTYLPKVFDKYKWLTKTVSTPGLPERFEKEPKYGDAIVMNAFHDTLQETVAFQKAYKNRNYIRHNNERITHNIASNIIRVALIANSESDHLTAENSSLYHKSLLETHWLRNYKFYQTKFRPTFCIRTKSSLDIIEKPEALTKDEVASIPGPYDPYALNVYRHPLVHLRNQPAMDNFNLNPVRHCHTTIMVNSRIRTDEQFFALATFVSFAQLISQAQSLGALHGTELKQPLVTQTIVTNGYKMAFVVYQLNTLYLLDDKNVWNRCWYSPVYELYKRKKDGLYTVFEDAERGAELRGFNENVCKYILNFIGNETKA